MLLLEGNVGRGEGSVKGAGKRRRRRRKEGDNSGAELQTVSTALTLSVCPSQLPVPPKLMCAHATLGEDPNLNRAAFTAPHRGPHWTILIE